MSYCVAVVTRNGAAHIQRNLDSLIRQNRKPKLITVVDDGSSDETPKILEKYAQHDGVRVIKKPDRGYDIRRVPASINAAWRQMAELGTEYYMISGDDCSYPPHYAASLLDRMSSNSRIVVGSGRPSAGGSVSQEHSPSGSGRMVQCGFWREVGAAYPVQAGWETWLLYKAEQMGFQTRLFNDLSYEHARPRGAGHQFLYWGAAMATLGYHPLYAIGRIILNALKPFSPKRGINLFRGYLQAELGSEDPFIRPYDDTLREYLRRRQAEQIARVISSRSAFAQ